MEPEELNDFLEYIQDVKGYLTALKINFIGVEQKIEPYLAFISKVGEQDVDPVDFYECITELYSVLGLMYSVEPKMGGEIVPCINVLDHLRAMFRAKQ